VRMRTRSTVISVISMDFFPGQDELTRNEELIDAVRTVMLRRGDGGMGWSMGWKMCIWARLGDSDRFMQQLKPLMTPPCLADNLFDIGPPFQIDGNFGAARGIAECLVQDHSGEVVLLPSLPAQWSDGSVRGMLVKGNHELDMEWKDGKLIGAVMRSRSGLPVKVRYKKRTATIHPVVGNSVDLFSVLEQ
jgi:alpha-L-fucosidase 2